jgi:hypothetical protein
MRYDADKSFPENEGWGRRFSDPNGEEIRTLENGAINLDTRASRDIYDVYTTFYPVVQSSQILRISWRAQVLFTEQAIGYTDVGVLVTNNVGAYAEFLLNTSSIGEDENLGGEIDHFVSFEPGTMHSFVMISADDTQYTLFVDDVPVFEGNFHGGALTGPRYVSFGDEAIGLTSESTWDYFEVAVVPEYSALFPFCGLFLLRRRAL